jgi:hypothetical protein
MLIALLVVGCGALEEGALPIEQAGPCAVPMVDTPFIVSGIDTSWSVSSEAPAGSTVRIFVSTALRDAAPAPRCHPGDYTACLWLRHPLMLGERDLNAAGDGIYTIAWPVEPPEGEAVYAQVLVMGPGGYIRTSPVMGQEVLASLGDEDDDGLSNRQEWLAGTSLFRADTDNGGLLDGQEVLMGFNPFSSVDDDGVERDCDNGVDDDQDGVQDRRDADCPR